MSQKGILQIDELRLVARPYLQIVTMVIVALGILGGWAGTEWLPVLTIFLVMIVTVIWIGHLARLRGSQTWHVYASAAINLTAVSIVVLITGGAYSPFWFLFLIGAVTSAMSYRGLAGLNLERLNAAASALVLIGPQLLNPPPDGRSITLAGMQVMAIFGSSVMIRKITTLILESRDRLAESEERYRALFDSARDVIVTLAPDGRITSLSPSFETFMGWPRESWLGRTFDGLLAHEDTPRALEFFDRILQGETLRAFRLRMHTRSGEELVVELNLAAQFKDGQVVGILGIARNMTEEQREEDIIKASERRFRALIENSSDAISLISVEGTILYESPSVSRVLGYSPEELVGREVFELLHPDDLPQVMQLFARIIQQPGEIITAIARYGHKDGSWLWIEGTGSNLLEEPGVGAIVVNYRDVTEQVLSEEELRRHVETMSALYGITRDLVIEHDLPKLLQTIVERATRLLNADGGGLYLCEPEKDQVRCVVSYNTLRDFTGTVLKYGEGAAGRVAQTGESLIIDDYSTWEGRAQTYDTDKPFRSVLSVPLKWQDEVIGVIHVLEYDRERTFTEDDLKLIELFANQATIAVHNTRMYVDVQQRNRLLSALQGATLPLMKQLELSEALQEILVQASQLLDTRHGYIYLVEPDHGAIKIILGLGVFSGFIGKKLKLGEGLAGKVWETGKALNVQDYHAWQDRSTEFDKDEIHSVVGVPLSSGPEIVGILGLAHLDPGRAFNGENVELLNRFAHLASIAYENARLYTQAQQELADRKIAEEALRNSEERYHAIYQTSGVSIWEEDYSTIKGALDELRLQGVTDFPAYFNEHPEFVQESLGMLKVVDVNAMTVKLYGARDKEELLGSLDRVFGPEMVGSFTEELVALAEGRSYIEGETVDRNLQGELLYLWKTVVFPQGASGFRNTLVCLADLTANKRAEEMLRLQSAALNAAANGIVITDRKGAIQWANPAFTSLTGFTLEEALGRNPRDLVRSGKQSREFYKRMWDTVLGGQVWQGELINRRKDGTLYTEEMTLTPVKDNPGEVINLIAVKQDITARKQAEDELSKSRAQLSGIIESAMDAIISTDEDQKVILFNSAAEEMFGCPPSEAIGQPLSRFIPERLRDSHREHIRRFERSGVTSRSVMVQTDLLGLRDDGSEFPIEASISQIDVGGKKSFTAIVRDITERKHAEDVMRKNEQRFRALVENGEDEIVVFDAELKPTYMSPSVFRSSSRSWDGMTESPPFSSVHPEDQPVARKIYEKLIQSPGREVTFQLRLGGRDGSVRWTEGVALNLLENPAVEGIVLNYRDITRRKRTENLQEAIYQIARAVATTDSLDDLFPQIHKALEDILPVDNFYIALYDERHDVLSFPYFVDQHDDPPPPQKPGHGLTGYVLRTLDPLLATRNVLDELVRKGEVELIGGDSNEWLGVPLDFKGNVLGVMAVQTYEADIHFSREDVNILTYVSTQVANAIERKRAEDEIRSAEIRYRTLVEQIPAIVYTAGPEQYIGETYVSPQIEQLGFTQEEWIADPERWLKQVLPEDRERVLAEIEEAKGRRGSFQSEYRLFKRDGQTVWIHDETVHVLDENGKPVLLQGIMLDITERKVAEERIKRQLDQLKALRTIDMTITASTDLHLSLQAILKQTISQLRVDAADVLLLSPATHDLVYQEGIGFLTKGIERSTVRIGEGFAGRVVQERRTIVISNLRDERMHFPRKDLIRGEGFECYFGAPLIVKGQVKGVLEIFHRQPIEPDQEWLDFLESLAGQTALAIDNATLFEGLRRTNFELVRAYETTLEGWSAALDLRDKETEGHTQRVTSLTLQLAESMGVSGRELIHIRRGALLHDIGKMGVPDRILLKTDDLTDEEWEIMRQHPVFARDLLISIEYLRPAMDIPYCHHEKWDGSGYPRGLKGEQIPLSARIFAVVDVYDALTSNRPYRPAWTRERTLEHIRSLSGTCFDPKVVDAFLSLIEDNKWQ